MATGTTLRMLSFLVENWIISDDDDDNNFCGIFELRYLLILNLLRGFFLLSGGKNFEIFLEWK